MCWGPEVFNTLLNRSWKLGPEPPRLGGGELKVFTHLAGLGQITVSTKPLGRSGGRFRETGGSVIANPCQMPESGHGKLPAHSGQALLPLAPSIAQPFGRHLEFGLNPRPATSESVFELDHPSF